MSRFIAIEAGGTKFICAISHGNGVIEDRTRIATTTPAETIPQVIDYIRKHDNDKNIDAIGIATFGPLDLDETSETYGFITAAPKPGWQNFDFVGTLKREFDVPIGFDTDVNAAALGEYFYGVARNINHFVYTTVGTGIGVGAMIDGKLLHGALHPEMGHMLIPQAFEIDDFKGVCPFHGNCLEGLASGPSMKQRWQVKSALDLAADHNAWNIEAHYLAVFCMNVTLCLSPKKIILGGGVMRQKQLFPKIRERLPKLLQGYIKHATVMEEIDQFISETGLGENSGIIGAIALAEQCFVSEQQKNAIKES